ncbi:MAG: MCE family protein [Alphaproteobacteria bacterium]|nr:MCE family protein [Alphaproteobacteria bacterium]
MNKTYKLTGLFVLIGLICLCGIVSYFIRQKYVDENNKNMVIMYFDESVRGLSVGSPVVLQGVEVGKVAKIRLMANLQKGTFKTPVYVTFNSERALKVRHSAGESMLKRLIDKGLRARLITANYLTGQLMIELIMNPDVEAVYRGTGKYAEIPTMYSSFAQISKDLEEVPLQDTLVRLGNLLDNIDDNLPQILENISNLTGSLSEATPDTMKKLNELVDNLNKDMPPLLQNMTGISAKIDSVMDKKNGEASKTMENINRTLEEISKAGRSMKNLTDYLERHPEAVIQGKEK